MTRVNSQFIRDEKQWFTEQRLLALSRHSEENQKKIRNLEKKFGKICFTPLSVPKIQALDQEKFVEWYFETCKPSIKQNKDIATECTGASSFLSVDLLPEWYDTKASIWSKNIVRDFAKQWPDLWEQFYEYLPFKEIIGFSIWSSTRDIIPHRDHSLFFDMPLEFRTMLHDPNPNVNLFISESLPNSNIEHQENKVFLPNHLETNSFVWNNLRSWHGSKHYPEHKKIIMIFHWANKIDWTKYEKLIECSYEQYRDYSLTSDRTIGDFINNASQ
jgi:hypothetical protein